MELRSRSCRSLARMPLRAVSSADSWSVAAAGAAAAAGVWSSSLALLAGASAGSALSCSSGRVKWMWSEVAFLPLR